MVCDNKCYNKLFDLMALKKSSFFKIFLVLILLSELNFFIIREKQREILFDSLNQKFAKLVCKPV